MRPVARTCERAKQKEKTGQWAGFCRRVVERHEGRSAPNFHKLACEMTAEAKPSIQTGDKKGPPGLSLCPKV